MGFSLLCRTPCAFLVSGSRSGRPERSVLEDQLKPELNHPRPAVAQPRITQIRVWSSGDRAEGRGSEVHVRQTQVGPIEKVEGFHAELGREAIVDLRHLAHGKIHDMQSWPDDRVAP